MDGFFSMGEYGQAFCRGENPHRRCSTSGTFVSSKKIWQAGGSRKKLEATVMVVILTDYQERSLLVLIFSFAGITQFKFGDISQALITEVIVATPLEDRYDQHMPIFVPSSKMQIPHLFRCAKDCTVVKFSNNMRFHTPTRCHGIFFYESITSKNSVSCCPIMPTYTMRQQSSVLRNPS